MASKTRLFLFRLATSERGLREHRALCDGDGGGGGGVHVCEDFTVVSRLEFGLPQSVAMHSKLAPFLVGNVQQVF